MSKTKVVISKSQFERLKAFNLMEPVSEAEFRCARCEEPSLRGSFRRYLRCDYRVCLACAAQLPKVKG